MKIVRTDRELETPLVDKTLTDWGHELVLVADGVSEDDLCELMADCELLLMCYTPITGKVIAAATRLRGIVKYGVRLIAAHSRLVDEFKDLDGFERVFSDYVELDAATDAANWPPRPVLCEED